MPNDIKQRERLLSLVKEGQLTKEEFDVLQSHFGFEKFSKSSASQKTASEKDNQKTDKSAESFWQKPLFGNTSLVKQVSSYFAKEPVPASSRTRYLQLMQKLETKEIILRGLESKRFSEQEFLDFFRIRIMIDLNIGAFKGLKETIELFEVLVLSLGSFMTINEAEFQYRSPTQLKIYDIIGHLLDTSLGTSEIIVGMKEQVTPLMKEFKTAEGLEITKSYVLAIKEVVKTGSGVKLLKIFRTLTSSYAILLSTFKVIDDVLKQPVGTDLSVMEERISEAEDNLKQFCVAIGMPSSQNNLLGHVRIMHFLALNYRHRDRGIEFKGLLTDLKKWEQIAGEMHKIKESYPANDYEVPELFTKDYPGMLIYKKYQRFLNLHKLPT